MLCPRNHGRASRGILGRLKEKFEPSNPFFSKLDLIPPFVHLSRSGVRDLARYLHKSMRRLESNIVSIIRLQLSEVRTNDSAWYQIVERWGNLFLRMG